MRSSTRQLSGSIIASVIIALTVFMLLLSYAPDSVPFSINNYGWNGMHQVAASYTIEPVDSLSALSAQKRSILLEIAPATQFTPNDASFVASFVNQGGTLVVADSSGFANSLLENLGIGIRIQNDSVISPIYNWKSPQFPISLVTTPASQIPFLSGVNGLALNTPSSLSLTSSAMAASVTSPASYAVVRTHQQSILGNRSQQPIGKGPFVLVGIERLGQGLVIVIGDSTFFTNSVWKNANNQIFVNNLLTNSTVYLDTSHWPTNTGTSLKASLLSAYAQFSQFPLRYVLTVGFASVAVLLLPLFSTAKGPEPKRQRPVENTTYSKDILNRIKRDRERFGVQSE